MRTEAAARKFQIEFAHDFAALSTEELESMAEGGQEVIEVHRVLAKTGDNIVGELLRGHETFFEWDQYPPGDVYDSESHGQFYYHAHPPDQRRSGKAVVGHEVDIRKQQIVGEVGPCQQ